MLEWLAMGGYAKYVWPSYGVFLLSLLGGWLWAAYRGRAIRKKILQLYVDKAQ